MTSKERSTKCVQNMHREKNVNMAKPVNIYIKEFVKYMQNIDNIDLDEDVF